jgi:hypothetical protein
MRRERGSVRCLGLRVWCFVFRYPGRRDWPIRVGPRFCLSGESGREGCYTARVPTLTLQKGEWEPEEVDDVKVGVPKRN